jgi:hypothetical protein
MEIVEAISDAAAAPPSDLYLPAMIGIIDPRNASHVIQILGEKLPLEMFGVSSPIIILFLPSLCLTLPS